ncbi:hypothetical protein AUC61_01325 [Pseudomonas sp. S25]|uniref:Intracellular septation protein A n=1 Tax=Pseudomonas maioricensis TaxID=1766623 RepID=A0ABS9ZGX3_9PSED|nr:hypothetical protein [Pseudomonas sp. S25]MCI8208163.1 hypothetical protein [Pseudomonas sp. S25]
MDKLLEYCKKRYDEELGFKFSLSNIYSWIFFVLCINIGSADPSPDIYRGLKDMKVKSLIDMTEGVIPSLAIADLLASVAFVISLAWLSRKLSEGLFFLFTLKSDFQLLIIDITIIYHGFKYDEAKRKAFGLDAKAEIDRNQKKARRIRSLGEVFLAMSLGILFALSFTWTNILISLASAIAFLIATWRSFSFFISSILPYYVAIKYSNGELLQIKEAYLKNLSTDQL